MQHASSGHFETPTARQWPTAAAISQAFWRCAGGGRDGESNSVGSYSLFLHPPHSLPLQTATLEFLYMYPCTWYTLDALQQFTTHGACAGALFQPSRVCRIGLLDRREAPATPGYSNGNKASIRYHCMPGLLVGHINLHILVWLWRLASGSHINEELETCEMSSCFVLASSLWMQQNGICNLARMR